MKASRNNFVEKGRMPDRVESFGKIDISKNCPKTQHGFGTLIRNRLRKIKNLIKSRPSKAETNLIGRENGVDFRKKSRRNSMMRAKCIETQKVREMNRKEAGESIWSFPILLMGMIKNVFQMKRKKCRSQERLKMWRKSMPGALALGKRLCLGQW